MIVSGDAIKVGDFYEAIYNLTADQNDDIHSAVIESDELEVITPSGRGFAERQIQFILMILSN